MLRKISVIFAFLIIFFLIFSMGRMVGSLGAGKGEEKPQKEEDKKIIAKVERPKVKVISVKNETIDVTVKGQGRVSALKIIGVTSEVQGQIISSAVKLKKGQAFSKGQLLYAVNDKEAKLLLKARKSNFMNLIATALPDLKIDYADSYLVWKGFFNEIDVDNPLPILPKPSSEREKTFVASRNIIGEYYAIKSDEEKLKKYKYYAPFSGSILEAYTDQGAVVNPGSRLLDIQQTGSLEIEVPVPVADGKRVKTGALVTLINPETQEQMKGKVTRVGDYINLTSQSVPAFVQILGNKANLYNGMYLNAEINLGKIEDVCKIPRRGLMNDDSVYLVKDSAIHLQKINVVSLQDDFVIAQGVEQGAKVVVEPLVNPYNEMLIFPIE